MRREVLISSLWDPVIEHIMWGTFRLDIKKDFLQTGWSNTRTGFLERGGQCPSLSVFERHLD